MSFTPHEREALLSARFVGPTVVQRLEEIGFGDMSSLAAASVDEIVDRAAAHLSSSCWKNSHNRAPQSPMPSQWRANSGARVVL